MDFGSLGKLTPIGQLGNTFKSLYGTYQFFKGNKDKQNLEANRPQRTTDPWLLYNQRLMQSRAGQGLGNQAYNAMASANDRNLGAGIQAILANGGSINDINRVYDQSRIGSQQLALTDAQWRQQNLQNFMGQNAIIAGENQKNWAQNVWNPYQVKLNEANQMAYQGAQNLQNAADNISADWAAGVGELGSMATSGMGGGMGVGANVNGGGTPFTGQSPYPNSWNPYATAMPQQQFTPPAPMPQGGGYPQGVYAPPQYGTFNYNTGSYG